MYSKPSGQPQDQGTSVTEISKEQRSNVQKEFPELAMTGQRALPTDLYRDQFSFKNGTDSDLTTASRTLNWATSWGQNPLVVSAPLGTGKSILAWQIMNEADNRGLVPIMVSAADIVTGLNLEKPDGFGRNLPFSPIGQLDAVIEKLHALRERGLKYEKSMVLIIDGIDPNSYNPEGRIGGTRLLKAIESLGIPVILNVESETYAVKGGSIDGYHRALNPNKLATGAVTLRRNGQEGKVMVHEDITFRE